MGKYDNARVLASMSTCNFGGVVILDIEYGIDDKVVTAFDYGDGFKSVSHNKLYTSNDGRTYFVKCGVKYYIDEFMRANFFDAPVAEKQPAQEQVCDTHYEVKLSDLRNGAYFRLRENGKVYVRSGYDRSSRKYEYYDFEDVNNYHFADGGKKVLIGFTF